MKSKTAFLLSWIGGALLSCGDSGGGTDYTALCNQACTKAMMCFGSDLNQCNTQCTMAATMNSTNCSNASEISAAYQGCVNKTCDQYAGCLATLPACKSTGGGAGGSGAGGNIGAGGGFGSGGTFGAGGTLGAGGSGTGGVSGGCSHPTPTGSCMIAAGAPPSAICMEFYAATPAMVMSTCMSAMGTVSTQGCPTTNLLGYCSVAGAAQILNNYYYGTAGQVSPFQSACAMGGGTWCTGR